VGFEEIYIVFYNSYPEIKILNKSLTSYGNVDDILYYETITVEELEDLKNKFIDAYKDNKFDNLYNAINHFCEEIINNLFEIRDNGDHYKFEDLYKSYYTFK
jgi:hypothetical protein